MRGPGPFLLCAALLAPAGALARPQFLFGARAGVAAPNEDGYDWGLTFGADIAWAMHRLAALELAVDRSYHAVRIDTPPLQPTRYTRGNMTAATLGVQYRIDITPRFVPYGVLAIESRWLRRAEGINANRWGGAFAVGILSPFAESWFAGIEARYGIAPTGAFPVRQTYVVRVGFTTARF